MTIKRKANRFCQALLLAAGVTAISVTAARPQDLQTLNDRVLENPQDTQRNLEYARAAEEAGQLRLALAAYERILINDPDNAEAERGYERLRRRLEPAYTFVRAEIGGQWDSNPLNKPSDEESAYSAFARATLIDERPIGPTRLRSIANFEGEVTPEIDELDYGFFGVQTGPIVSIAPHNAIIPSIGGGVATLGGSYYFDDINAAVTLEGRVGGLSYWTRLRGGWRNYSDESTAEEGSYAEVIGGVAAPRVGGDKGSLVALGWVRRSEIDGTAFNFAINEEITPGVYTEYGADVAYNYRASDHVSLSAGVEVRDRHFTESQINGEDRHDTHVTPEATVSFQNLLPCECSLNVTYRYRHNSSNDATAEHEASQVSVSLFSRF